MRTRNLLLFLWFALSLAGVLAIAPAFAQECPRPAGLSENALETPGVTAEQAATGGESLRTFGWDEAMAHRLDAAGEETLLTLLRLDESDEDRERRRLLVVAYKEDSGEENLQDKIALLGEQTASAPIEREVSLRPAAPPRFFGSPPAISRHGYRDRSRWKPRGRVSG